MEKLVVTAEMLDEVLKERCECLEETTNADPNSIRKAVNESTMMAVIGLIGNLQPIGVIVGINLGLMLAQKHMVDQSLKTIR